jgi:hypothetical protein
VVSSAILADLEDSTTRSRPLVHLLRLASPRVYDRDR